MLPQRLGLGIVSAFALASVFLLEAAPPKTNPPEYLPRDGVALYQKGEALAAAARFEAAALRAAGEGDRFKAMVCWNATGGSLFTSLQYQRALSAFQEALRLARSTNDRKHQLAISVNLSSLYLQNGDLSAASAILEPALAHREDGRAYLPFLLAQQALVALARGNPAEGTRLMREAAAEADLRVDLPALTYSRQQLAWLALQEGRLEEAEALFSDSLRLGLLLRLDGLEMAYRGLARLRLAQGRVPEAERLASAAIASYNKRPGTALPWPFFSDRAAVRSQTGDISGAVSDYRIALDLASRWRAGVLTGDSRNIAADVKVSETIRRFAHLLMSPASGPGEAQAREAFLTTERSRAFALRATRLEALLLSSNLDAAYGESLARLRRLEALPAGSERNRLRSRIASLEAGAGLSPAPCLTSAPAQALSDQASVQRWLGPGRALISLLPGEQQSLLWTLTANRFEWRILPSGQHLSRLAGAWSQALLRGDPSAGGLGLQLSKLLFGSLSPDVRACDRWLLSVDDFFFSVPFSALPDPSRPDGYLLQSHSFTLVPSVFLPEERPLHQGVPLLAAIGDAVYNQADPRWKGRVAPDNQPWRLLPPVQAGTPRPGASAPLPRLVGTRAEVEAVSQIWAASGRPARQWLGSDASESSRALVPAAPAVLHFAAHVVLLQSAPAAPSAGYAWLRRPGEIGIAIGLGPQGEDRFLTPEAIAALRLPGSLVVMNGCSSGRAEALPGAGLLGLTRAWLAAGADAVVATLWPTADDADGFFPEFYREYVRGLDAGRSSPATALRSAQLAALRSTTWRAHPRYWAAYFVIGKE